jgi:hypothetical protein
MLQCVLPLLLTRSLITHSSIRITRLARFSLFVLSPAGRRAATAVLTIRFRLTDELSAVALLFFLRASVAWAVLDPLAFDPLAFSPVWLALRVLRVLASRRGARCVVFAFCVVVRLLVVFLRLPLDTVSVLQSSIAWRWCARSTSPQISNSSRNSPTCGRMMSSQWYAQSRARTSIHASEPTCVPSHSFARSFFRTCTFACP